jgi:hypothetical protein
MNPLVSSILYGRFEEAKRLCRTLAGTWATPGKPTPEELAVDVQFSARLGNIVASMNILMCVALSSSELTPDERVGLFDLLVGLGATCSNDEAVTCVQLALTPMRVIDRPVSRQPSSMAIVFYDPSVTLATRFLRFVTTFDGVVKPKFLVDIGFVLSVDDSFRSLFANFYSISPHGLDQMLARLVSDLIDAGFVGFSPVTLSLAVVGQFSRVVRALIASEMIDPFADVLPSPIVATTLPGPAPFMRGVELRMDSRPSAM